MYKSIYKQTFTHTCVEYAFRGRLFGPDVATLSKIIANIFSRFPSIFLFPSILGILV